MNHSLIKPIGEFIEERTERLGKNPTTIYSVTNDKGFVRSRDLFDKQVFSLDTGNYKRVGFNDLAYNPSRINVGSIALCEDKSGGAVSPMYCIVRCKNGLLPQYLLRFLKSDVGLNQIRQRCEGAVRFQLKIRDLSAIPIYLPPLVEQNRIVKLINEADELRKIRIQTDQRSTELIPALFHEMFCGNKEFPEVRLSDVCEFITKGSTPKISGIMDTALGDCIPFLKVFHITEEGSINFVDTPMYISRDTHNGPLSRSKVYPGDVLMNIVGPPLGKIGVVPDIFPEWNVNQALAIFRPTQQIISDYLLHALREPRTISRIISNAVGIRQLNLSLEQCRDVSIRLPPIQLQQEFASRVSEIRKLISGQFASRRRLNDLFQSMLHRAFEGEL